MRPGGHPAAPGGRGSAGVAPGGGLLPSALVGPVPAGMRLPAGARGRSGLSEAAGAAPAALPGVNVPGRPAGPGAELSWGVQTARVRILLREGAGRGSGPKL